LFAPRIFFVASWSTTDAVTANKLGPHQAAKKIALAKPVPDGDTLVGMAIIGG
jgi:hypothetical protein